MKVYVDLQCKCHATIPDNGFRAFELDFFDGKCPAFIEGYIYCPPDESYTREDGEVFWGECIVPWKPYPELDAAQRRYEKELLKKSIPLDDLQAAYREGVISA